MDVPEGVRSSCRAPMGELSSNSHPFSVQEKQRGKDGMVHRE